MNYSTIAMVIVVGLLLNNFKTQIDAREQQADIDAVTLTFTQLAQAQYQRRTTFKKTARPQDGMKGYAANTTVLVDEHYLPIFKDRHSRWTFDISVGLKINFDAGDAFTANQIAARLGALASVTGDVVTVGFASPTELALLNGFVEKAGDTMTGQLIFSASPPGQKDKYGLDLFDNNIQRVGAITAKTVIADMVTAKTVDATTVTNVKNLDAENITGVETLDVTNEAGAVTAKTITVDTIIAKEFFYTTTN